MDAGGAGQLGALGSVEELDRYCYYVAGTVGHLLTALFWQHHGKGTAARRARLEALATSFGLGLQLTNIIKDIADDRQRGRSYVPRQLTELVGINPEQIQDTGHRDESRAVMEVLIRKAERHLRDVDVAVFDQSREMTEHEGQQQHLDVRAVDIGVRQDADLSVAQSGEIG